MGSPSACCFSVSPLCSDTLPTAAAFSCPICSLICSQLLQFAFAEDPHQLTLWFLACLCQEGPGTCLCLQHISFSCSGSAEILLLSAVLAQRLQGPPCAPWLCSSPVVIPASLCWVQCPALSGCPGNSPRECRQQVDVPCYQHSFWPAFHASASVSGVGHCWV